MSSVPATPESGGQGDDAAPVPRSDLHLTERAMRQRWPIPAEKRLAIIARMTKIVTGKSTKNREAIAAAKVLLAAEAQNIHDEDRANPQPQRVELTGAGGEPVKHEHALDPAALAGFARDLAAAGLGHLPADGGS